MTNWNSPDGGSEVAIRRLALVVDWLSACQPWIQMHSSGDADWISHHEHAGAGHERAIPLQGLMKVYVSGALAAAKDLAVSVEFYEWMASALTQSGFEVHLPHKANHPSAHRERIDTAVYNDDLEALLSSDVCLARLDEPSLGVGAEIAIALERRIPVVAYHKSNCHVSRFVTGLIRRAGEPNTVISYADEAQLVAQVEQRLNGLASITR